MQQKVISTILMKKRRILCLIDTLGLGGAERQMIGLTLYLKQRGYHVDLVTYIDHDFYTELVEKYGLGCVNLHTRNNKLAKLWAIRKLIWHENYDVVIAYKNGPAIIGCLLKILGGTFKLIVSERNTTQRLTYKERIKFWLYKRADYIVSNAFSQEKYIKEHFSKLLKKTITITNFTDTHLFVPIHQAANQPLVILTAARIAQQKNILNYLEAVRKVKDSGLDVRFHWFGDVQSGEEVYGETCRRRIRELGIDDCFVFHPASTNIVKEYQSCDIFCLPSCYEGYPNVLCEAMSCGKPVLCSRICDNPFIVEEGNNGLMFNPLDIDDIVEKVAILCRMSIEQRLKMGLQSREIAEEKFSEVAFVDKYIKLIEDNGEIQVTGGGNTTEEPAVIVIGGGGHHNTLGVIRALGLRGYNIEVVLQSTQKSYVAQSKYIKKHFQIHSYQELTALLLWRKPLQGGEKEIIISCADEATEMLNMHRDILSERYVVPGVPEQGRMVTLMDKLVMKEYGQQVGFLFPEVFDINNGLETVQYPCITKANVSSHGGKADVTICSNKEQLEKYLDCVKDEVFIQRYIKKCEEVQFIGCSLNDGEKVIIPGMTRILRSQYNTNTGFLTYGPIDDFYNKTVKQCEEFLKACKYSGLFSMEFLRDENDKVYFLEINFRNDGNAWCVTASGVNLPVIWVKANSGIDYCNELHILKEITVMPEFQDFKLVLQRKLGLVQWLKDLRRTDAFLLWNKHDQKPFWWFIRNKI